jgi:hypothetical protein
MWFITTTLAPIGRHNQMDCSYLLAAVTDYPN